MLKKLAMIGLATSIAFAPIVLAPMAAKADNASAVTAPAKPANKAAAAKVTECSEEADAKGLQAKPRKKFLAQCKRAAM